MPAADYKGPKKQLNVWVLPDTGEYLRLFAKERGLPVGKALDLVIDLLRNSISNEKENDSEDNDRT